MFCFIRQFSIYPLKIFAPVRSVPTPEGGQTDEQGHRRSSLPVTYLSLELDVFVFSSNLLSFAMSFLEMIGFCLA